MNQKVIEILLVEDSPSDVELTICRPAAPYRTAGKGVADDFIAVHLNEKPYHGVYATISSQAL
jgi:hypothetical protein